MESKIHKVFKTTYGLQTIIDSYRSSLLEYFDVIMSPTNNLSDPFIVGTF